jgi:plastocyanin
MRRRELLATGGTALATLGGCLGGSGSTEPRIEVLAGEFEPMELPVDVGTAVTWVNRDERIMPRHEVESKQLVEAADDWEFRAPLDEQGDTASHTFEREGIYTYFDPTEGTVDCMCGLVAAGDVSFDGRLPCGPGRDRSGC